MFWIILLYDYDVKCQLSSTYGTAILYPLSTGNFDSLFFLGITPFWTSKFDENERYYWNSLLAQLNRISWNFVVMKDIICRCAYPQEILLPFSMSYALFELRNWAHLFRNLGQAGWYFGKRVTNLFQIFLSRRVIGE